VAAALLVFAPVLLPAVVVLAFLAAFLVLMVVEAFGQGAAVGCAALAALIGLPSIGLLWLSAAIRVLGHPASAPPRSPSLSGIAEIEARYRSGDFIHRDYEAEQRDRLEG
jgi:hypothetical protein